MAVTKEEVIAWALTNGFQKRRGFLTLVDPKNPEKILVMLRFKKLAFRFDAYRGQRWIGWRSAEIWERVGGGRYAGNPYPTILDGVLRGAGTYSNPDFARLIEANKQMSEASGVSLTSEQAE